MRINSYRKGLLPATLAVGMLALGSCTNNDYDLNKVDMTMGFGGGEITLPNSSTGIIKLADVLDLEEDGSVVLDADSNYVFRLAETTVDAAKPYVEKVRLEPTSESLDFVFNPTSGAKQHSTRRAAAGTTVRVPEQNVMNFSFSGNSHEVKSLSSASISDTRMTLTLTFPSAMASCMPTLSTVTLNMPGYLKLSSARLTRGSGNVSIPSSGCVVLSNVSTSGDIALEMVVSGLDFTNYDTKYGELKKIENGSINISGRMTMAMEAELTAIPTVSSFTIHSSVSIDEIVVNSAKGIFDPTIDLNDLGEVNVTGVPDFLRDGDVNIDLANPQIRLKVASNMEVGAKVDGKIIAIKDGQQTAAVDLQDIDIKKKSETADDTTRICICRSVPETQEQGWDYYPVANLSSLVRIIPDRIKITDTDVQADQDNEAEFEFGKHYTVAPSYSVEAPLAFAEDARIVYKDSTDGWHKDIKDLELSDGSYVEMTANVESRVPVYLEVKAEPMDENGNVISAAKLKVEIPNGIDASADGKQSVTTPISIKISQLEDDALKLLDGLRFTITGAASKDGKSVTGITLNARDHTLKLTDVLVKLKGKVIGDFN